MTVRGRLAVAVSALGVACAIAPASAGAFAISSLTTQPSDAQAGGHPNVTLSLRFSGGDTPKSMTIDLPAGLVGNPNAAPKCPQATFRAGGCSPASAVGSTTVYVSTSVLGGSSGGGSGGDGGGGDGGGDGGGGLLGGILGGLGLGGSDGGLLDGLTGGSTRAAPRALDVPVTAPGTVYVLEPSPGEPARLGIEVKPVAGVLGTIRLESPISVRDGSDFGLTSTLDGLPRSFAGMGTTITGMDLTLFGSAADGPFVTLPTTCTPATTKVSLTTYGGASASATAAFTPTGCGNVPFTPGLAVDTETTQADSPSGFTVHLAVPGDEVPVRQSYVSNVRVTLPLGTGLNPGTAAGLQTCADSAFARGSRKDPACPADSAIGSVAFTSPLVGTLSGTVYEGAPTPSQRLRLFVDVPGPGLRIKLIGNVDTDPRTGQVTSTFPGLPQLPFTAFALSFRGGPKAILTTPPECGTATSTAVLTPYSGGPAASAASQFQVSYDGRGTACPSPMPFAPSISTTATPSRAGASTSVVTTVSRDDRTQRLGDMALSFPPGLLGGLGHGIGLCDLAKARTGDCPADSRVGSASLVAGPGPAPLTIGGDVFLTVPPDGGSLAGLAITVPGKVGPFDLGTTVSLARIAVRPGDSGLDVTASGLPQIVGGIPLDLRRIALTLDRPGFMRNATSCAEQQVAATFTAVGGQRATSGAPYQATDCDKVPFKPRLSGVVGPRGQLGKGGHPAVTAVVSQGPGEISTQKVTVTLPAEIGADITRLTKACPAGQDCGDRNTVGRATAVTPLLPIPLTGPVKLVTPQGGGIPVLQVQLSGLLHLTLIGKTALTPDGKVLNTFEGIPDVPLSRFELALGGGKAGILLSTRTMRCGQRLTGQGRFTGYSGATRKVTGTFVACGKLRGAVKAAHRRSAVRGSARLRHGTLSVTVHAAKRMSRLRVAIPKPARLTGRRGVHATGGHVRVHGRSVTAAHLRGRVAHVTLGRRALHGAGALRRHHARLTVRVLTGGRHATVHVPVR